MLLSMKVNNGVEDGEVVLDASFLWTNKEERFGFDKVSDFFQRQAFCGDEYDLDFGAEARWGEDGNSIYLRAGGEVWQSGISCADVWDRAGLAFSLHDAFAGALLSHWQATVSVKILSRDLAVLFKLAFQDETTSVEQVHPEPLPEGFG